GLHPDLVAVADDELLAVATGPGRVAGLDDDAQLALAHVVELDGILRLLTGDPAGSELACVGREPAPQDAVLARLQVDVATRGHGERNHAALGAVEGEQHRLGLGLLLTVLLR